MSIDKIAKLFNKYLVILSIDKL